MANLGTPTVIGTLSNATSQTTYTVPITATSGLGDYIAVVAGSSGGGANNIPSSITDSQGQTYTMYTSTTGVGQLTYWRIFNSKVLTSSDTLTVTYPVANTALKNIIVIDCPGAVYEEPSALVTASGNSATPTVVSESVYPVEIILFIEQNGVGGGSPTGFTPFTNLSILHSGSNEYTSASYLFATPGPVTASCTITSSTWSGITVGLVGFVPVTVAPRPFPIGITPIPLAFNPATQFKTPPPQPPIPTVISSGSANIPGAQANVFTPGINFLTGNNANFTSSQGNWVNGGGTTIAQVSTPTHNATGALQITATASGSSNALSSTAAKITTAGMPVTPGDNVFVAGWVLAATTGRAASIGVSSLDESGNIIGSTQFGAAVTDNTTTWQLVTNTATIPAGATRARVAIQYASVVNTEVHYLSDVTTFNITSGSGMGELVQIFTPSNQQFQFQPLGLPLPLSLNLPWLPRQLQTGPFAVFQGGTTGAVSVAAGAGTPAILQPFAQPFPFQPLLFNLQLVAPGLTWMRPPRTTGNIFANVDGGNASNVTVNANFADISVVVSVSATTNVSVVAQIPQVSVTGTTANVNVQARNGTVSEALTGTTSNVNVAAISGTLSESIPGAVANVSVQARNGTVVVTPVASASANVNVTMAGDNVVVITMGSVANVAVASTASSKVSPQGTVTNVNTAAVAGSTTVSISGTVANVTVATTEGVAVSLTASPANVSVAAPGGIASKIFSAPTATVSVASTGVATSSAAGVGTSITVTAIPGTLSRSLVGVPASVNVASFAGQDGNITITGFLVNADLAEDLLLSDKGKLLSDPVTNILVSATTKPKPQGI